MQLNWEVTLKPKNKEIDGKKECNICGIVKDIKEFNKSKRLSTGYTGDCKDCRNARNREHYWSEQGKHTRQRNSRSTRSWRYRRDYGISVEDYDRMYKKQGGSCAICSTNKISRKHFDVDHCHTTGKVRGLLCHNCNKGLGLFKDNLTFLHNALFYLLINGE